MTHAPVNTPAAACWRLVGIDGDRSCPELATHIHCRNCPVVAAVARDFFDRPPPPGYLEDWRDTLERPVAPPDTDAVAVLVFRLGDEWLGLPTKILAEVALPRRPHRVPHRGGGPLLGLVNLHGQVQPCVCLGSLLGLRSPIDDGGAAWAADPARLLVAEWPGERRDGRWILAVDEVAGLGRVAPAAMRSPPATVQAAAVRATSALFDWRGRPAGLLDPHRLLDALQALLPG